MFGYLQAIANTVANGINWLMQFLYDLVLYFPRLFYHLFVNGVQYAVQHVPDPCCLQTITQDVQNLLHGGGGVGGSLGGIDLAGGLAYLFDVFQVEFGLRVMFCALIARFILRRIPGVG